MAQQQDSQNIGQNIDIGPFRRQDQAQGQQQGLLGDLVDRRHWTRLPHPSRKAAAQRIVRRLRLISTRSAPPPGTAKTR